MFFFQAEDGIRDLTVTGVQTCALPILAVEELALVLVEVVLPPPPVPGRLLDVGVTRAPVAVLLAALVDNDSRRRLRLFVQLRRIAVDVEVPRPRPIAEGEIVAADRDVAANFGHLLPLVVGPVLTRALAGQD